MKRKTFYIDEDLEKFLKDYGEITVSEHIRRALTVYIKELKKLNVSTSQSK